MDVRDRYLRALVALDDAIAAADAGTRTVLGAYRQQLKSSLLEFQATIQPLVEGMCAGWGDNPSAWDQNELEDLAGATIRGFDELAMQHFDLGTHLPGSAKTREDLKYLLMRAADFSLILRGHDRLLSVHAAQKLTWEATRFTQLAVDGPIAAAIAVPWLETYTPLRWPIAVHELGHYFLPGGEPVRGRTLEIATTNGWRDADLTSFHEIVADAVAQHAFGDTYAFALAREGYLLSYETHVEGGVSVAKRLELLNGPGELFASLPRVWRLDRRARPGAEQASTESTPEACLAMRAAALDMVGPPPSNRPDAVAAARQLIRQNEPPVAVTQLDAANAGAVKRLCALLESDDDPLQPDEVSSIAGLAVQQSLTDGEILQAAWLEECDRDGPAVVSTLMSVADLDIEQEARAVTNRDTWLARALQSSAVHRWLLEGERRVAEA